MTKPAPPLTSNINLCLSIKQNAGHEARIIRHKIAKHETEIIALRAEYEKLVRHAAIENISLDDPAPEPEPVVPLPLAEPEAP